MSKQVKEEAREVACPLELMPFVRDAPLPVMVRSCLEWMLKKAMLEELFEETAQEQYTRELTLSFLVDCVLDVACGIQHSALKALYAHRDQMRATTQAFYAKLRRMEPQISAAVVKQFAELAQQAIASMTAKDEETLFGYRVRIVDGTVLGGRTENRIQPLRFTRAAGLTGMALAVYAPAHKVVRQVILEEDAYTQERALLSRLEIEAGELWLADRNFCIRSMLFRLHRGGAAFLMRWHGNACPYQEHTRLHRAKGSRQGAMEHHVWLQDPETQERLLVRRIVLPLEKPTRDGDTELILLTNVPDAVAADDLCQAYAGRWQIEVHYQRLTQQLHCEPPGLNYPRAALFAFAMSVIAGNALAVVQAALRQQHGEEAVHELSYHALVLNVAQIWLGMAIVMPTEKWHFVRCMNASTLAQWLSSLAQHVPMTRFRRARRGPKKPHPKTEPSKHHHYSTKRLLDRRQKSELGHV